MEISVVKTKVLHVSRQEAVSAKTSDEAKEKGDHVCPHLNCGFRFLTERGSDMSQVGIYSLIRYLENQQSYLES